ncbi:hypothetical protein Tco_1366402 [Tanacetum coccineum]
MWVLPIPPKSTPICATPTLMTSSTPSSTWTVMSSPCCMRLSRDNEVKPALENMVVAAKKLRAELASAK